MSDESEWEVIVPPLQEQEADDRFRLWQKGQEAKGPTVRPEDVRRDQIHEGRGISCVIRYLVRKKSV